MGGEQEVVRLHYEFVSLSPRVSSWPPYSLREEAQPPVRGAFLSIWNGASVLVALPNLSWVSAMGRWSFDVVETTALDLVSLVAVAG